MDFGSEFRYDEKCDDRFLRMRCTGDWSGSCSFTVTTHPLLRDFDLVMDARLEIGLQAAVSLAILPA